MNLRELIDNAMVPDHGLGLMVIRFTPELAGAILAHSRVVNRNVSPRALKRIARQMPEWCLNGEPIILSKSLDLYEGHHRLTVCRDEGLTFTSVAVILDSDDDRVFHSINTGEPRFVKSLIEMKNPNLKAGATLQQSVFGYVFRYCYSSSAISDRGNLHDQYRWATADFLLSQVVTAFQADQKELKAQLAPVGVPASVYCAVRYLGLVANPEVTTGFFTGVLSGSGISQGDAETGHAWLARTALQTDQARHRHQLTSWAKHELLRTYLAWRIEQRQPGWKHTAFKPTVIPGAEPRIIKERLGLPIEAEETAA